MGSGIEGGSVPTYEEVRRSIGAKTCHLLLGNGFSIACDPVFQYGSLYDTAVEAGLSERAQEVFDRLGTNNFEGVLTLLENAAWTADLYGAAPATSAQMRADADIVKNALIQAVTQAHLAHTGMVSEAKYAAARQFLNPYHNIFTTNYDLLLYWTILQQGAATHQDGFRSDDDDPEAPYVIFSERLGNTKGLFYLHGALHLCLVHGQLRKHCWNRTGQRLTELIRAGLAEGIYPLFVAEGSPEKKLEQIQRVGYLWYSLDKFSRIESPLVVFGHSFSPSDAHTANAIADNLKLPEMYIGLHGDPNSDPNLAIHATVQGMARRREERNVGRRRPVPLQASFFNSDTAAPWGAPAAR